MELGLSNPIYLSRHGPARKWGVATYRESKSTFFIVRHCEHFVGQFDSVDFIALTIRVSVNHELSRQWRSVYGHATQITRADEN
jgi:hypothetical protein